MNSILYARAPAKAREIQGRACGPGASIREGAELEEWVERYFRVEPADVSAVEAILEGYEGMVSTETIDPRRSVLRVAAPRAFAADVEALLADLARQYRVARLPEAEAAAYAGVVPAPRRITEKGPRKGETPPGSPSDP